MANRKFSQQNLKWFTKQIWNNILALSYLPNPYLKQNKNETFSCLNMVVVAR